MSSLREYGMIVLDTEGRVTSWNVGAESITGYTAAEAVGRPLSLLHVPSSLEIGHPDRQLMAAAANGTYEEESWHVRKDGTRFWAELLITAIRDDAGELACFGSVIRDLTERKQAAEQAASAIALLDATAHTDFLTGLPNRRALDLVLEREISVARLGRPLSVAMIDLDNFKRYNDELGHKHADRYLRQAAEAWKGAIRNDDYLARYGGEEFTVVLPGCLPADALLIVERLRTATPEPLSCSGGVAGWDGKEDASQLVTRADRMLIEAKQSGRNRILLAVPGPGAPGPRPAIAHEAA